MPLRLTNERDIHLAQEWIVQLHAWIVRNGLQGHDPFDVKAHPCIAKAQHRPWLRKGTTALCDLFPNLSRRVLRIPPAVNPKALALTAIGHLRLFQITGDALHLENGRACLERLESTALPGYSGMCWGYPFPMHATGLACPPDVPVAVVCAIAGEAFLLAYDILQQAHYLDAADSIRAFMLNDLPRMDCGGETWCFGYTPRDRRRVHNANLLVVEHLIRTAQRMNTPERAAELEPALAFSLSAQRDDGAWPYGAHAEGEPFEAGLMRLVDHHHTGFVLRSLYGINAVKQDESINTRIRTGYRYYKKLIRPNGMPVNEYGAWPVDIHACAEGILCNSVLLHEVSGAENNAVLVMRWTHSRLRDNTTGAPWYRKYPLFTSHIVFPRWGVAWMYRALAEYLFALRERY